ncbi:MAG: hypothetical protein L6R42_006174 [Xanthoria sp. 1 TBL-2021]|nr:MAG: hypothetical protein L6R42_006174 [Xanthoria sp. 1 TBL-2021]
MLCIATTENRKACTHNRVEPFGTCNIGEHRDQDPATQADPSVLPLHNLSPHLQVPQTSSEGPAVKYPSIPTSGDPDIPTTGNPTTEVQDKPMPDFSDASKHDRSVAYGKSNAQEQTGKHLLEVLNNQAEMAKSIKSFEKELGSHAQQIKVLRNAPSPEQLHLTVRDLIALAAELERVKAEFLVTEEISEDQLARRIDGLDTKLSKWKQELDSHYIECRGLTSKLAMEVQKLSQEAVASMERVAESYRQQAPSCAENMTQAGEDISKLSASYQELVEETEQNRETQKRYVKFLKSKMCEHVQ